MYYQTGNSFCAGSTLDLLDMLMYNLLGRVAARTSNTLQRAHS
jgi:hypothetical protein